MATNARTLIEAALGDIGVLADGESMTASQGQQGLARLNNMVSSWRTQPGLVVCVQRTLFPLVDDQQTYTIGVGGDFNVPRPQKIDGAGLLLSGVVAAVSVTSITRSSYTATVTQTAHGYAVGDEVLIVGANERPYNGLQTVQTVPTANTYTFTVNGLTVTPATGTITAAAIDGQPTEQSIPIITDSGYQFTPTKNLPNSEVTSVYYNPTFPFGTIVLWPKPTTTANQIVLYLRNVFTGFADLTTDYDWPDVDGYAEALQFNLALRLCIPYSRQPSNELKEQAAQSLGLIKRANNKLVDLPTDARLLTRWPSGWFNINSGTTQGTGN